VTQPTQPSGGQDQFPDAGQVEFDAETVPDEAHVDSSESATAGPQDTAAPAVGPEGPFDEAPEPATDERDSRIAELTADLQRLQAEYLNYKRRVDRDRDLVVQNAKLAVLTALLPALDDVDRAREHEELSGGFKAVAEALERVVSGAGLEKFGAHGDEFDPRLHEAVMHGLSSEVTTTVCDNVFQAGYRMGDRVVRAAKVTVLEPEAG
jgi:molecular chaperone GrpE